MLQQFTGFQYLLIDLANHYGLDKELFETRLDWAVSNLDTLEALIGDVKPKNKPLYFKTCMSIRKAQKHQPTGHMVGFDAICSGIQVMSALTGCAVGLKNTGLIGDSVREDAYQTCTNHMSDELGGFTVDRELAKSALMKCMYGSQREPKLIFGDDTPELSAFYVAAEKTAPGAWQLLQELLGAWQAFAPVHEWTLPDGFQARVRVKEKMSCRPSIDELGGASFTYVYKEYQGTESGISLPANVTHSVDAYVLRCVHRRCNYDPTVIGVSFALIQAEQVRRLLHNGKQQPQTEGKHNYYVELYNRTAMPDVVIAPYITASNVQELPMELLRKLELIFQSMFTHNPFSVVTVHDEFRTHGNNMNHLRKHYVEIFAELADSTVLQSILNKLTNNPTGVYKKHGKNLGQLIRQGGNYAIC